MILCRSATCSFGFREQRFDPRPLFIREVASVSHVDQFNHYWVFCIQTLGKSCGAETTMLGKCSRYLFVLIRPKNTATRPTEYA